ncbi:HTH-type transcriptional regulator VirS [compost metagenome]
MARFYLEGHYEEDKDLHAKVRQQIQMLLPKQRCSLEQVALILGLHARTLQRRLASDSVEFEQIVEQVRYRQARHLLQHTQLTIPQIALELGYRSAPSFYRAHYRWFDCTPIENRQRLNSKSAAID